MNHAKGFMKLRRPSSGSSKDSGSNDSKDDLQTYSMLSDSYSESFLDLAVLPAPPGSAQKAQWKLNTTPRSSDTKSYISKPRSSSKEVIDRRASIAESLENAITPVKQREMFLQQQQRLLEAQNTASSRGPVQWNNLHDSEDQIISNLIQDGTPKSARMTYQKDSSRTATTQNSSQSTITTASSTNPQSPYCRPWQSAPTQKSRSAESSPASPSQRKNPPPRTKSADSLRTKVMSNKAKGELPPLRKKHSSSAKSSSTKKSMDNAMVTSSLVLSDKTPMTLTPQGKQSKTELESVDVSPRLKTQANNHKDGDGSDSKALATPIRTPPAKWMEKTTTQQEKAMENFENSYSSQMDEIKVAFSPDDINRSIEDQRALAKEMAEELAGLPTSMELKRSKSWVAAERENAALQTSLHGTKHSPPPQRQTRPRMAGRRTTSTRSFVPSKGSDDRLSNVSGHSRGVGRSKSYTGERSLGGRRSQQGRNEERKPVRRTRSSDPLMEMSGHSRRSVESALNRSSHHSRSMDRSGHSRSSHKSRHRDRSLNLSGHRTKTTDSRSRSDSPGEINPRKAGRRPKTTNKPKRRERSADYTAKSKTRARSSSCGSQHGVTIHVSEQMTDKCGHTISIEVSGKLKERKSRDTSKYSALNRRREQRRKESHSRSQSPGNGPSPRKRSESPKIRSRSPGNKNDRTQSPGNSPSTGSRRQSPSHSPSVRDRRRSPHQNPRRLRRQRSVSSEITGASTISSRSKVSSRDSSRDKRRSERSPSDRKSPSMRSNSRGARAEADETAEEKQLFECSFNGSSQIIDLDEWESESEASHKRQPGKNRSRTIPVAEIKEVEKQSSHTEDSAKLYKLFDDSDIIKPKSSTSMLQESNSIDVDNVISHMETLHDLEKLSNQKVQEQMKRHIDCRIEARGHLLQLMERKMSVREFRDHYGISFEDTKKLIEHVKLCLKMNEEIRWDLVFHILLSDGGIAPHG